MIIIPNRALQRARGHRRAGIPLLPGVAALAALMSAAAVMVAPPTEAGMSSVLTLTDSGRIVDLRVGDEATLRLPDNPSTGYRWAVDAADTNLVEIKEGEYVSTSKMVGGGGEAQWLIKAKAPGTTVIKLKRWRPWEGDCSIVERYGITIRIML